RPDLDQPDPVVYRAAHTRHAPLVLSAHDCTEHTMNGLTHALAAYIAQPDFGADETEAAAIARQGMTDTIAVALAGHQQPVARIALDYARTAPGGSGEAAPLWFGGALPANQAALVNGVAGHALDYDDVALSGHPSTVLTPAILAQ